MKDFLGEFVFNSTMGSVRLSSLNLLEFLYG